MHSLRAVMSNYAIFRGFDFKPDEAPRSLIQDGRFGITKRHQPSTETRIKAQAILLSARKLSSSKYSENYAAFRTARPNDVETHLKSANFK